MSDRTRLDVVTAALRERGYRIQEGDGRRCVAVPTAETRAIGVPGPLLVASPRPEPTPVLETVGAATEADRRALFVAHPHDAAKIRDILTDPPGIESIDGDRRTFYNVPDRLPAGDEGWACCRAGETPRWRTERTDASPGADDGASLVCAAGGEVVAAFESVEGLSCPPREVFPYAYRRTDAGQFVVDDGERIVGRFGSVRAMKTTYQPIPVPLVPERVVDGHLPSAWALAVVEDGAIERIEGA
ncbi:MAG: hypothetical protein PPP58_02220 [Natronomonas sp.]